MQKEAARLMTARKQRDREREREREMEREGGAWGQNTPFRVTIWWLIPPTKPLS
jgi:hypothetical protein